MSSFELQNGTATNSSITQNLNETANQTANQTANAVNQTAGNTPTGTGSEVMEFWSFLGDPLIMVPTIIFAVLIIGATLGMLLLKRKNSSEPVFEKDNLQDLVKPSMKELLKLGKSNNSIVRRDLRTEGKIHRDYRITEKTQLLHGESEKKDINILNKDHDDFDTIIADLRNQGVISQQAADDLKDDEIVPHRLIQVKPVSRLKKSLWIVTDLLMSKDMFTDYYLVPEMGIVDNGADESISIDRNLQFRPFAGLFVPMTYSSMGIISSAVFRHLYEISLEDQSNYHKQVNEFASQFSQDLQKLEKKIELEQQQRNNGTLGKMNNS